MADAAEQLSLVGVPEPEPLPIEHKPAVLVRGLSVQPCTVTEAVRVVGRLHRHLPKVLGGIFAVAAYEDGRLVGVAIAGRGARVWEGTGRIVITRVAVDGTGNACSMLYGAICRAAKALGYREAWTYTLPEEPGTSLRAAGFTDEGTTDGGEWDRALRPRAAAVRAEPKRRWRRILAGDGCPT